MTSALHFIYGLKVAFPSSWTFLSFYSYQSGGR